MELVKMKVDMLRVEYIKFWEKIPFSKHGIYSSERPFGCY